MDQNDMMNSPNAMSFAEIMMLGRHAATCDRYHVAGCDHSNGVELSTRVAQNGQLLMQSRLFVQDSIWPHEDFSGINARNFDVGVNGFW